MRGIRSKFSIPVFFQKKEVRITRKDREQQFNRPCEHASGGYRDWKIRLRPFPQLLLIPKRLLSPWLPVRLLPLLLRLPPVLKHPIRCPFHRQCPLHPRPKKKVKIYLSFNPRTVTSGC